MTNNRGTIKRTTDKGFGFIATADGTEYFFHHSACSGTRFEDLSPGQAVRLHARRVWLRLGDPTSVRLRVNGHTLQTAYPAQPINLLVTSHGATQL